MSCHQITPMDIECKPIEQRHSYEFDVDELIIKRDGEPFAEILSLNGNNQDGTMTGQAQEITPNKYSTGTVFNFTIHKG